MQGQGSRVQGSGLRVQDSGFRFQALRMSPVLRFGVQALDFGVWGLVLRIRGQGFRG